MQNIFKSTILKIKNNAEEEYTEFKKTKWLLEFIKIFITALVTTTVLFVIRSNSKGELEGVELKEYLTYELLSLANAIGKRYCLCQLLKDGEQYGTISTKPMELFKLKNY